MADNHLNGSGYLISTFVNLVNFEKNGDFLSRKVWDSFNNNVSYLKSTDSNITSGKSTDSNAGDLGTFPEKNRYYSSWSTD